MAGLVPDSHADLLSDEKRAVAYLVTLMPDRTPQVTPVWFQWDGGYIWINSARGRVKDRNMRIHPQVALLIPDPADSDHFLQIRGIVLLITEDGASQHANRLAQKYTGQAWTPNSPDEVRVKYKIKPEHIMVSQF